jgi:hypothetical protein
MTGPQLQWADACELSNMSRPDLPSTFVLRLSKSVCADLGVAQPESEALIDDQHSLVRKFVDSFTDSSAIDSGTPFRQVPGKGLYRIRAEHWRGLVWTDKSTGVVWLCRAVSLADHPSEDAAYDALAGMGDDIFPVEKEREDAKKAQVLAHALQAMHQAMQEAHELPNSWQYARMVGPGRKEAEAETIGRAYVEQIEEEDEVVIDRFLIAVTRPPAEVTVEDWVAALTARVFPPQEGEVEFIGPDDLPDGPPFSPGPEIALAQQAF